MNLKTVQEAIKIRELGKFLMETISKSFNVKCIFAIILKNSSLKFIKHGNFYKNIFDSSIVYQAFGGGIYAAKQHLVFALNLYKNIAYFCESK